MILNPNPHKFGLEGAHEAREKSIDQLCRLKLEKGMPDSVFFDLLRMIVGGKKNDSEFFDRS